MWVTGQPMLGSAAHLSPLAARLIVLIVCSLYSCRAVRNYLIDASTSIKTSPRQKSDLSLYDYLKDWLGTQPVNRASFVSRSQMLWHSYFLMASLYVFCLGVRGVTRGWPTLFHAAARLWLPWRPRVSGQGLPCVGLIAL